MIFDWNINKRDNWISFYSFFFHLINTKFEPLINCFIFQILYIIDFIN